MTMNATKTLMIAAFAAVSLGAGSAMAQEGGSGITVYRNGFYQAPQTSTTQASGTVPVQSGSSDVEINPPQSPHNVTTQPQFDFSRGGSAG
jgi:hypothetical protein